MSMIRLFRKMSLPKLFVCMNRANVFASLSGILFFVGWWLMIDINVNYFDVINKKKVYYLPGLTSTLALIIVNAVPSNLIKESNAYAFENNCHPFYGMIVLFFGFLTAFGSIIGAGYIIIADFILKPEVYQWPGYGIFLQNVLIFVANVVAKFCIKRETF